ncbi:FAD-dependent oxidoreductase [Mycolicibacterium sp.]|uniref:FAD-dependent oxidoreductase n=1 Tax=Mycolicibacterium sp. TaxID=2320850 RepID=UPI003D0D82EF
MAYVITRSCCNDASCVAVCPVNCIHPSPDEPDYASAEMLYIDPQNCIDCGACVDVCPVEAIHPDFELDGADERYLEVNQRYYDDPARADYPPSRPKPVVAPLQLDQPQPLRVAVVGSGPAGCYTAEALLNRKGLDVDVHVFERLPAPWGLVRYGVAPDHPTTKAVTAQFTTTAARGGVTMHLNVAVGTDVSHDELLTHHHAVVYASGAAHDRRLGIAGEDLPGSHPATDFVGWYNGHPDHSGHVFDLSGERAVIVGNGNVALDVARILTVPADALADTDIAEHALRALAAGAVTEVVVLGRRGAEHAAFTTPELLALDHTEGIDVLVDDPETLPDPATVDDPVVRLKMEILHEIATRTPSGAPRRIRLRFLSSPVEALGTERLTGVRVVRNELIAEDGGPARTRTTTDTTDLACGLLLRAIGYRAAPLPGLPFDETTATLPNTGGRVLDPATGTPVTGVYTAGWLKRGPSGGIGTNKACAAETVAALIEDYTAGRLVEPRADADALDTLVELRKPEALDFADWQVIDKHERAARARGPRQKITTIGEMLRVARSGQEVLR